VNVLLRCKTCGKEHNNKVYCNRSCLAKDYSVRMRGDNNPNKNNKWSKLMKQKMRVNKKEWYKYNEHPRGMLGKKHTEKKKNLHSQMMRGEGNSMFGRKQSNSAKKLMRQSKLELCKQGWRPTGHIGPLSKEHKMKISKTLLARALKEGVDYTRKRLTKTIMYNGVYLRSQWELRTAKVLDILGIKWEYEKYCFIMPNGESYTPDFYLPKQDLWLEVKGSYYEKKREYKKSIEFANIYNNILHLRDDVFNKNNEYEVLKCTLLK